MSGQIAAERLSEIIGMIYDCALDAALWPIAMAAIQEELDFCNAALAVNTLPSGATAFQITTGMEDKWRAKIGQYERDIIEMWGGFDRIHQYPLYEPIVNSHVVERAILERNRYYLEWSRPQGIEDGVVIGFARDTSMVGSFAMGRHGSAGPIQEPEITALRMLAPHFRRSISISKLLDIQSLRLDTFQKTLDAVASAILLVDGQMRVIFANSAAETLQMSRNLVFVRDGRLHLTDKKAGALLQAAVVQAAQDETSLHQRGIGVPARSLLGLPSVIHLLPLRSGEVRSALMPKAVAAIFIAPAPDAAALPIEAFAALYELTPAQARIAELVAQGMTQKDICLAIGVQASTAKSHLLQIFAKTGCSRQLELAVLVKSFLRPV